MNDVYVHEFHPVYQVWVNGAVYDTFISGKAQDHKRNQPLTWSQQWDVAQYYKEALSNI